MEEVKVLRRDCERQRRRRFYEVENSDDILVLTTQRKIKGYKRQKRKVYCTSGCSLCNIILNSD